MYNLHNKIIAAVSELPELPENTAVKTKLLNIAEEVRNLTAKFEKMNLKNQRLEAIKARGGKW